MWTCSRPLRGCRGPVVFLWKTSCKNSSGAKTLGNCVLVTSGTFWIMLNHCDLDFLSILRRIWTRVRWSGGSMTPSVQTGKQSTYFLWWVYFIFPLFCFHKCWDSCERRLLALWNIALRIVVCWTLSFSKSWNSFQVLFCSQHCVLSASLWPCKCENIAKLSCK